MSVVLSPGRSTGKHAPDHKTGASLADTLGLRRSCGRACGQQASEGSAEVLRFLAMPGKLVSFKILGPPRVVAVRMRPD